ncbi:type III secretion protein HrpV [Pseudomonas asuensis]|uniref:Negative regulator of hrp expression HrpV n=1 Tax=Pseudomonas asuensis TaxID=1825787 RepID=A0ABQ2H385_9PSED|nr:type III secretion protein HrpV [Pseudomonas asuensis]GGM31220.1 negative regulator of hrp expression HrpV [Pseudomonas asuensis]
MIRTVEKQAFYTLVLAERVAIWSVANGVSFVSCREHLEWGMALHIQEDVLTPDQLRTAVKRRFSEAERYRNYFLSLDSRCKFAVWHALPNFLGSDMSLEEIRRRQFILTGLEHLMS